MSKKLDPDIKVLRACMKALRQSSSKRAMRANVKYLYDRCWDDECPCMSELEESAGP